METGKTTKYLKYAIGEIVLVVIGILIALAINNWNEQRKDRDFEIKMLKEVKIALVDDKIHFKSLAKRMESLNETANFFVSFIASKKTMDKDSLYYKIFSLNRSIRTQFNKGAYSALKAAGIDKISNDSLRNHLIYFYDFQYPNFISLLNHYNRNSIENIDAIVSLLNNPKIDTLNNKLILIQEFPKNVLEQPKFLKTLRGILFRSSRIKQTIEKELPIMQQMIDKINNEIK